MIVARGAFTGRGERKFIPPKSIATARGRPHPKHVDALSRQRPRPLTIRNALRHVLIHQLFIPLLLLPPFGLAQSNAPPPPKLDSLLEQLASDAFREREAARSQIVALGMPVYDALDEAARTTTDAEVRHQCLALRTTIARTDINAAFRALHQTGEGLDIETGMFLTARILDPTLDRAPIDKALDDYALAVGNALAGQNPKDLAQEDLLDLLGDVLFKDAGFTGAPEDRYAHPDNSSISRVLGSSEGLPIILSHILIAVAERVGVQLEGVHTPGRYIVRFPSRGAGEGDMYVDPFDGGRIMTRGDLPGLFQIQQLDFFLKPRTNRETLNRMLRNLTHHLLKTKQVEEADWVLKIQQKISLPPGP